MRNGLAFGFLYVFVLHPLSAQITLNPSPTRVIGQTSLQIRNVHPNLVEGREFFAPQGVALDTTTNPPGLYVADTGNNRVLGFRNAAGFANGQKADVVLGPVDFLTTTTEGPTQTPSRTTGLATPTGMAVDSAGNLYTLDSGNNRILRFPKPFTQTGDQVPDLVIGQPGFSTNTANQGGLSASTLAFANSTTVLQAYIAFDPAGNLWVADAGNNRILRFNASVLANPAKPGPAADVVLGQYDFVTNTFAPTGASSTSLTAIASPTGIAFDSAGRLFVDESVGGVRSRILMWTPPFATGQAAARLLAVDNDPNQPPTVSPYQLRDGAGGLFSVGNQVGVADSLNHRLLIFPPVEQWTSNTFQAPTQVIGQVDFNSGSANQGQVAASASTLAQPGAAVFSGTELYVADTLNHRVVVLPQSGSVFGPATRVLGQDALDLNTVNLLEGREFDFAPGSAADAGMAVDLNSSPPHLYVADTYNNRILGFRDLRNLQPGAKADIVIGQPDFQHSRPNYPTATSSPNQSGLLAPTGLLVDSDGNLYVADTGNGRVLRFPKPFDNYTPGAMENADLVLGQSSFFFKITDATSRTMSAPYGLAMTLSPGLMVSDVAHNRVLFFRGSSKTFVNGQAAEIVFGQKNFTSSGSGSGSDQMNLPHHIASDSDDRLYVADTGNARVMIFDHAPTSVPGPQDATTLTTGLSTPRGLYVSPVNGDIWVADANTSSAIRYPPFNQLQLTNYAPNATLSEFGPIAVTEDGWGNVFIADVANRVVIHYPGLSTLNAANFLFNHVLAPGMIASVYSTGNAMQFGKTALDNPGTLPLPQTLNGLQVLFNNAPVPLFYAGTDQINFQVPNGAPQSGTADLQIVDTATGRVLGDTTVAMTPALPGLFTTASNGSGALVAANQDGKQNTQTNPAVAGTYITLYGTGEGFINGVVDGNIANTALPIALPTTVLIGAHILAPGDVQYSGVAPTLVGVWQINAKIPADALTLPTSPVNVVVFQNSVASADARQGRVVQIYVKQP